MASTESSTGIFVISGLTQQNFDRRTTACLTKEVIRGQILLAEGQSQLAIPVCLQDLVYLHLLQLVHSFCGTLSLSYKEDVPIGVMVIDVSEAGEVAYKLDVTEHL